MLHEPTSSEKYYIHIITDNNIQLRNLRIQVEDLTEENEKLKKEIKLLQWRLHEQD